MAVYLKLMLAALFWGGTYIAGRMLAQEAGPYSSAFLRYFLASGLLLLLVFIKEGRFPTINLRLFGDLLLLGATGIFGYNILFFLGMKHVEAGRAALIVASNPVFITLGATIFFRERFSPVRIGGVLLCLIGAVVVISRGNIFSLELRAGWGEFLLLGCTLCWTAYSLLGKGVLQKISPLPAVAYCALLGTLGLLPLALWEGLASEIFLYRGGQWSALLYLSLFGTVLSFLWYYEGIREIGPSRAAIFINFVPVAALFLSWLILGEPLSPYLFIGAALITAGAWLGNTEKRQG